MKTENLSTLKIHQLSEEQYKREKEAGRLDESALYLTPDEGLNTEHLEVKELCASSMLEAPNFIATEDGVETYNDLYVGSSAEIGGCLDVQEHVLIHGDLDVDGSVTIPGHAHLLVYGETEFAGAEASFTNQVQMDGGFYSFDDVFVEGVVEANSVTNLGSYYSEDGNLTLQNGNLYMPEGNIYYNGSLLEDMIVDIADGAVADKADKSHTHNYAGASSSGGAATSANKLASARTIALGAGVTGIATTFDGTSNITIPVTDIKESYLSWGGKNIVEGISPVGAALSAEHSANRLAFLNPNAITIEYSNDAGSTWTNSGIADDIKVGLVTTSANISVGSDTPVTTNHRTRITLAATDGVNAYVYTRPRKMLINVSTPHNITVTIEARTGTSDASWTTFGTYDLRGWSAWNDIPLNPFNFGHKGNTSNYWYIRLTFEVASFHSSSTYLTQLPSILGLRMFGDTCWGKTSNMGETGHLYSYDANQNATFPASVSATSFTENGTTLSSKYAAKSHTHTPVEVGADPLGSASKALTEAKSYTDTKISDVSDQISDAFSDITDRLSASQTASYTINETGWTRIAKLSDNSILTRFDFSIVQPRLAAPTVTLTGDTINFEIDDEADIGVVLLDGEEIALVDNSFDLSTLNLFAGTYSVTVKSRGTGWVDSVESPVIKYNVEFDAGLYDANNNLVATWSTLTNNYGMNASGTYLPNEPDWEDRKEGHPASILAENPELSTGTKLVIPGTVSWIGTRTFAASNLTEVVLLDGVDRICDGAFAACDSLTRVVIPDSVTHIEQSAFMYCESLYKIEIPKGVTTVGTMAFSDCTNLSSVTFNVGLKTIELLAFRDCQIQKLVLPEGLETIGVHAFEKGCLATSVTIPKSVKELGSGVFYGCPNMEDLFVEEGNENFKEDTFVGDDGKTHSVLVDISSVKIVQFPTGYSGSFSVPVYIKAIGGAAFGGSLVGDVYLPNSLERIEDFAFSCSANLNILSIPQSVTYIGSYAFEYCGNLVGEWNEDIGGFMLRIAGVLEDIGSHLFIGCKSMVGIHFEDGLPKIEAGAFLSCLNLKYISIPDTVVSIGEDIIDTITIGFQFIVRGTDDWWNDVVIATKQKVNWQDNIVFLDEAPI